MTMPARKVLAEARRRAADGRHEDALAVLHDSLEGGAWWAPRVLDGEPDLAETRRLPGWGDLRARCAAACAAAQERSRPRCTVVSPATATWDPRTLFVIHGRGESGPQVLRHWQPLVDDGWTLVVPQSSQVYDSEGWCWDDAEAARAELRSHWDDCQGKRGIPLDGLVVAGVSQGAPLALELARDAAVPWLCVVPTFPREWDPGPLTAVPSHTRGAVILGDRDPAAPRARGIVEMLQAAGVKVVARTMQGAAHELPAEFGGHAAEALRALLSEAADG
jgi:predicted esterase